MIRHSHLCQSCRLCVKQQPGNTVSSVQYWCTRRDNIRMVGAPKWMPVKYLFGCRFWVEKARGEHQRVIDADGKRIGKTPNNSRAIQYSLCGVARILDLRAGEGKYGLDENLTRSAIGEMIEANKAKRNWTSREIVQWFLVNGAAVNLPEWYFNHYESKTQILGYQPPPENRAINQPS